MLLIASMIRRRLLPWVVLSGAAAVPYAAVEQPDIAGWLPKLPTTTKSSGDADGEEPILGPEPLGRHAAEAASLPLEGEQVQNLAEVFRFDVSPGWVYQRWSRKTTALSNLQFHGVRVPLVTGTGVDDLAGSLTYYFGSQGRCEWIEFVGRTGDARRIVDLASKYGLRPQPGPFPGEQRYEFRWNGKAMSRLTIRPAEVLWATTPHAVYQVHLQLQRPGSPRFLDQLHQSIASGGEAQNY